MTGTIEATTDTRIWCYCDRCGKGLTHSDYMMELGIIDREKAESAPGYERDDLTQLCARCEKSFELWMRQPKAYRELTETPGMRVAQGQGPQ